MRTYTINPNHVSGRYLKTIVLPNREPRVVRFLLDGFVELDAAEIKFLQPAIGCGIIAPAGTKEWPKPAKTEPARRDPREDPRDDDGNPIPERELSCTEKFHRDLGRMRERRTSR